MMDQSPNLLLLHIMPAQAQKHVTHNEAVRALDAVVQLAVADRDLAAPLPLPLPLISSSANRILQIDKSNLNSALAKPT